MAIEEFDMDELIKNCDIWIGSRNATIFGQIFYTDDPNSRLKAAKWLAYHITGVRLVMLEELLRAVESDNGKGVDTPQAVEMLRRAAERVKKQLVEDFHA